MSRITEGKYLQLNQISIHSDMNTIVINTRFIAAPQKGVSLKMASSHDAPHLCTVSWSDILDTISWREERVGNRLSYRPTTVLSIIN